MAAEHRKTVTSPRAQDLPELNDFPRGDMNTCSIIPDRAPVTRETILPKSTLQTNEFTGLTFRSTERDGLQEPV